MKLNKLNYIGLVTLERVLHDVIGKLENDIKAQLDYTRMNSASKLYFTKQYDDRLAAIAHLKEVSGQVAYAKWKNIKTQGE